MNNIISTEDINYLTQQSSEKIDMILSGMTALMNDIDAKVSNMESQNWFQRMIKTVLGKNKATLNEIKKNHDKLDAYMVEAISELYKRNCINEKIIMSLSTKLNEVYENNIEIKQMLGAFVSKLNEKIESVDNFHILETEIEQGVYSSISPIYAICKIISQIDKRTIQDSRKMDILKRSLTAKNIINDTEISLVDYLMNIIEIPIDEVGAIYLELQTLRGNFIANTILNIIEKYHFLSNMERKLKDKQSLINQTIVNEQLDSSAQLSIDAIYNDFIETKTNVLNNEVVIKVKEEEHNDNKGYDASNNYLETIKMSNNTLNHNSKDEESLYVKIYNRFKELNFEYPKYISFYNQSPNNVQRACKSFCKIDLEKEQPIFCFDSSVIGSNAHGFLVSDQYLYWCNTWEQPWYMPLNKIKGFEKGRNEFNYDVMILSTYKGIKKEIIIPHTQATDIDKYGKLLNYIVALVKG